MFSIGLRKPKVLNRLFTHSQSPNPTKGPVKDGGPSSKQWRPTSPPELQRPLPSYQPPRGDSHNTFRSDPIALMPLPLLPHSLPAEKTSTPDLHVQGISLISLERLISPGFFQSEGKPSSLPKIIKSPQDGVIEFAHGISGRWERHIPVVRKDGTFDYQAGTLQFDNGNGVHGIKRPLG